MRVIHLPGDGHAVIGEPPGILRDAGIAPPIAELGRAAGWDPLPLSVHDARRRAAPLCTSLAGYDPGPVRPAPAAAPPKLLAARGSRRAR